MGSYRTCRRPALGAGRLRAASQRVGALLVARWCGEARVWVGRKHSCKISNTGRKFRCVGCDASSNRVPSRSGHPGQPARARRKGAPWARSPARARRRVGYGVDTRNLVLSLSRARTAAYVYAYVLSFIALQGIGSFTHSPAPHRTIGARSHFSHSSVRAFSMLILSCEMLSLPAVAFASALPATPSLVCSACSAWVI